MLIRELALIKRNTLSLVGMIPFHLPHEFLLSILVSKIKLVYYISVLFFSFSLFLFSFSLCPTVLGQFCADVITYLVPLQRQCSCRVI